MKFSFYCHNMVLNCNTAIVKFCISAKKKKKSGEILISRRSTSFDIFTDSCMHMQIKGESIENITGLIANICWEWLLDCSIRYNNEYTIADNEDSEL